METQLSLLQHISNVAGVALAVLVYLFNRQQKRGSWLAVFNDLHRQFWEDDQLARMRARLACDTEYDKLKIVIEKRLKDSVHLKADEYAFLEDLDKFFNFLLRVKVVNPQLGRCSKLWDDLYFQYWINKIYESRRYHIWVYFEAYYRKESIYLLNVEPDSANREQYDQFIARCNQIKSEIRTQYEPSQI